MPLSDIQRMSISEVLDYQEALEAISLLKEAAQKDAEHEARLNAPQR